MRKFIHNSLITAALAGALATGNAIPAATGNAKVATGAAGSATAGDAAGTPAPARVAPSADAVAADRARNIRLPKNDIHYRKTRGYVEDEPVPEYVHASAAAHERFRDIKFAVRIHWGVYALKENNRASWNYIFKMRKKGKAEYDQLYKTWNPTGFDADEWCRFFAGAGIRCVAFTTKHHDGFSMFHTKTRVKKRANYIAKKEPFIEDCDLAYSIEETPFKRDVTREICDAARRHGLMIDLYFSHPDWYDADFRPYAHHPLDTPAFRAGKGDFGGEKFGKGRNVFSYPAPERTAADTARLVARHREQLRELLTNYGKIDMICLDQWLGSDIWPQTRETLLQLRALQPDVMFRCRGIGNYGDYYTPEGFVPGAKENTNMPWMTIYALGRYWDYEPDTARYKGTAWIVRNIVDCAAKGGSFMVGIGPDANGKFHPEAIRQINAAGAWLRVNGEAIYNTTARKNWKEGDDKDWKPKERNGDADPAGTAIRYTQTKDGKTAYAFFRKWPADGVLTLRTITPRAGTTVTLLGTAGTALKWETVNETTRITLPAALLDPAKRPCADVWCLRIEQ